MLEIRKSSISELENASNIKELLEEYAAESAHKGMPYPNPDWDKYFSLEKNGSLHVFIAENNNQIIGFITLLVTVLPHYSVPMAITESFFVRPEFRKTGAALKLLRAIESYAKESGAFGLLVSAPHDGTLAKVLYHSYKYSPSNIIFFYGFQE